MDWIPHKHSKRLNFDQAQLAPNIDFAFQALALDERRYSFRPEIWSKYSTKQRLKQCWFLGSHSDIGGGYKNPGFANIALCWMSAQLSKYIEFDDKAMWDKMKEGSILRKDIKKANEGRAPPPTELTRSKSQTRQRASSPLRRSVSKLLSRNSSRSSKSAPGSGLSTPKEEIGGGMISTETPGGIMRSEDQTISGATAVAGAFDSVEAGIVVPTAGQLVAEKRKSEPGFETPQGHNSMAVKFWAQGAQDRMPGVRSLHQEPDDKSTEEIHSSVSVLTGIGKVQDKNNCRPLQEFKYETKNGKTGWFYQGDAKQGSRWPFLAESKAWLL